MLDLTPRQAHELLGQQPDAVFIDCRSEAEYLFVGHPAGAVHVPWAEAPDWDINPHFVSEVRKLVSHSIDRPVVIICRSGNRSVHAGQALEAAGFTLVDPDAITVGASYFDVQAGDWTGQVIVGELMEDDGSFATVQWFLTRP